MIKITVLIDDTVRRHGLTTEHGLSFHIRTEEGNVLFDTGQTGLVRENAGKLGVDPGRFDAVVLSHGHYDHTGGLPDVVAASGPVDVHAHPGIFRVRYAREGGGRLRETGPPWSRGEVERLGARFRLNRGPAEVLKNVYASGAIPRRKPFEKPDGKLVVRRAGKLVQDWIRDDQALVVTRGQDLFVFLGCCHSGLINTLDRVSALFPRKKIRAIAGGLHLLRAGEERISKTVESLIAYSPETVAACHCTGPGASALLYQAFGKKFVPLVTGDTLTF